MLEKLQGIVERYDLLERQMADPRIIADRDEYQKHSREHAELAEVVAAYRQYRKILAELAESQDLLRDPDPSIKTMARGRDQSPGGGTGQPRNGPQAIADPQGSVRREKHHT